ncbi:PLP-dependent aspartate aminotransferase family protein [Nocardioides sp.]|uniref:trans-sulfuration enzyme family protein n=1 Tax=Nocardioides sp. TaxID=35761 RepID=UPI002BE46933|nr:PLP-dependent aspartate aminotransferase family protein [Nocardioides sp.]HXH80628.1 PLP-dependent aspartate aminotransferase family protein [Nocardioides sp.]
MTRFDTLAVHAGRDDLTALGVHALPIDLSTTNPLPSIGLGGDSYESMATGGRPTDGGLVYQRLWNPTVARFEEGLATLERTESAVAFSTGMAALSGALLAAVAEHGSGRHVVAVRPVYGGTDHLLASGTLGVETTFCAAGEVAGAIRPDTVLVVLETPANPTLELVDIKAVTTAAGDVPVLVDNTFATPVLQNPAALGAALVLHSATKYLGGHGDAMGGIVACDERWAQALRRVRAVTGGLLHPMGAYLLHRGLATLPLRMRAQQEAAGKVAGWLSDQCGVGEVYFPGLPECDPQQIVGRQMRGPGAMVAFSIEGGYAAAARFTEAVTLFTHAVSLGGVDSLVQHPAALTHRPVANEAKPHDDVLRLSIGLEDPEDLCADLARAFAAAR